MNRKHIFILLICGSLFFTIVLGHWKWQQRIEHEVNIVNNPSYKRLIQPVKREPVDTQLFNTLIEDYEAQLSVVLTSYEEEIVELISLAEQDYYLQVLTDNIDFQTFVHDYADKADNIRRQHKYEFEDIVFSMKIDLLQNDFSINGIEIYQLLFEQAASNLQMTVVSKVISFHQPSAT